MRKKANYNISIKFMDKINKTVEITKQLKLIKKNTRESYSPKKKLFNIKLAVNYYILYLFHITYIHKNYILKYILSLLIL